MRLTDQFPWLKDAAGLFEPAATMGTAMAAEIPAGLYGLYELARTKDPAIAAEGVRSLQDRYTYTPRTEQGMRNLGRLGEGMERAMGWGGLLGGPSMNDVIATAQEGSSRLFPPAVSAAIEGVLAAPPPARASGNVLRLADRATDQAQRIRKAYEAIEGRNQVAKDFGDLWKEWWDESDPEDVEDLISKVSDLGGGPRQRFRSPQDRLKAAATIASAQEAGANISPKVMDNAYRILEEVDDFRDVMASPLSAKDISAAQSQRNVDALESGWRQMQIDQNPNRTFPERRQMQMDVEDMDLRNARLLNMSDQEYLDAIREAEKSGLPPYLLRRN